MAAVWCLCWGSHTLTVNLKSKTLVPVYLSKVDPACYSMWIKAWITPIIPARRPLWGIHGTSFLRILAQLLSCVVYGSGISLPRCGLDLWMLVYILELSQIFTTNHWFGQFMFRSPPATFLSFAYCLTVCEKLIKYLLQSIQCNSTASVLWMWV